MLLNKCEERRDWKEIIFVVSHTPTEPFYLYLSTTGAVYKGVDVVSEVFEELFDKWCVGTRW
jgi:hypothetical protein